MKLVRIGGSPLLLVCAGCGREGIGGGEVYLSASTGEERAPEEWYQEESPLDQSNRAVYCAACAVKLTEIDPTRAVTQFYADTKGMEIKFENLPE